MVDDLTEKIQSSQNKLQELMSKIPGFGGYMQKEQRRDADKMLRLYVARQYGEQLGRLSNIQHALTSQGGLNALRSVATLERAVSKLQLLIDRIKTASYGYAGLFDPIKVDEEVLDRLYDFDQAMLAGVDTIAADLDTLDQAVQAEEPIPAPANQLIADLETLNNTFSQRQDVILE